MKKLITLLLLVLVFIKTPIITYADSVLHTNIANNVMDVINGIRKHTKDKINDFRIKFDDFHIGREIMDKIYDIDVKTIVNKLGELENTYYERLLKSYKIDINDYKKAMQSHHYDDEYRKQYIMEKTKISEQEYNNKFVNPFKQITKPIIKDNMSLKEIKELYKKYVQDKIDYLNKILG